jgi:hypothetical protein
MGIEQGTPVVATYGYNKVTKKPYKYLYEFGYYNNYGGCVVYNRGECNMQDAHVFDLEQIRIATKKELSTLYWGS